MIIFVFAPSHSFADDSAEEALRIDQTKLNLATSGKLPLKGMQDELLGPFLSSL